MDNFNSELLIQEVKKHPCLYNIECSDFTDRIMKKHSWISIIKTLVGESWDEMKPAERNNVGREIQKRWKSIRDSYVRALKKKEEKTKILAKSRRPYIYFRQLSFLNSALKLKKPSKMATLDDLVQETIERAIPEDDDQELTANTTERIANASRNRSTATDPLECSPINIPQASSSNVSDPDEMFFLSQVPQVKRLNPSDKLDFQLKFLQLLQAYLSRTAKSTKSYS